MVGRPRRGADPGPWPGRIAGNGMIEYPATAITMPHAMWKRMTLFIDVSFQGLSESAGFGVGGTSRGLGEADWIGEAGLGEVGFGPADCGGGFERKTVIRNGVIERRVCAAERAKNGFSVLVFLEELVDRVHGRVPFLGGATGCGAWCLIRAGVHAHTARTKGSFRKRNR